MTSCTALQTVAYRVSLSPCQSENRSGASMIQVSALSQIQVSLLPKENSAKPELDYFSKMPGSVSPFPPMTPPQGMIASHSTQPVP